MIKVMIYINKKEVTIKLKAISSKTLNAIYTSQERMKTQLANTRNKEVPRQIVQVLKR